jgi:protein involved in polysaccharide export with SLBB domain
MAGCAGIPGPPTAVPPPARETAQLIVAPAPRLDPALLLVPSEPFTLGPGDKVEIEFVGDPSSRTEVEVGPDGKIYFYLLPELDVWGLTLPQTRDLILRTSGLFLRRKPDVSVTLLEAGSRRVWILGQVNDPGVFPMAGPMTLLEALAGAGGPTPSSEGTEPGGPRRETADLQRGFVLRRGRMIPVDFPRLVLEGDPSQNIYLQPGDFVYIPSATARTVHVLGAVSLPGAVSSGGALTLVQTIAGAGGTVKDAYLSHVAIVRGSLTHPTISIVDYQAVIRGRAPDVLLEPHDIVYVPYTPYRTLTRYVNLILETFVETVGVNEGAHAINSHTGSVSASVQVSP